MGFLGLGRGTKGLKCDRDLSTGKVKCKSFRQNKDGTREILAEVTYEVDGNCNAVQEESAEYEDGELQALTKKITPAVIDKCLKSSRGGKPSDY